MQLQDPNTWIMHFFFFNWKQGQILSSWTYLSCFLFYAGYMVSGNSLSHRLGGLYCLYCLFETQPFKPPFKIYLCLRKSAILLVTNELHQIYHTWLIFLDHHFIAIVNVLSYIYRALEALSVISMYVHLY